MKQKYRLWKRLGIIFICIMAFQACADTQSMGRNKSEHKLFSSKLNQGMQLEYDKQNPRIKAEIAQIKRNNRSIFRNLDRERIVILNYIIGELEKRDMPFELAMMPLIESSYSPAASNRGRHVGLWQLGGPTARTFGVKVGGGVDGRYNIKESTTAALDYLQYLNKMFDGDWLLTIAAYNAGEGRVLGAMARNGRSNKKLDYWSLNLPRVTQDYIPKVLALSQLAVHENRLNVSTMDIPELIEIDAKNVAEVKEIIRNNEEHDSLIALYNPRINNATLQNYQVMLPESILSKKKLRKHKEFN